MLDGIAAWGEDYPQGPIRALFEGIEDGRAKLYVTWRLLQLRRAHEALFTGGGYTPLRASGARARHVVAFARRHGQEAAVTVVPRLVAGLGVPPGTLPCGAGVWGDTRLHLPFVAEGAPLRDVIGGAELRVEDGGIDVARLLALAPVAVLRT